MKLSSNGCKDIPTGASYLDHVRVRMYDTDDPVSVANAAHKNSDLDVYLMGCRFTNSSLPPKPIPCLKACMFKLMKVYACRLKGQSQLPLRLLQCY